MKRVEFTMNGKAYRVVTMDVGRGPQDYVFVEVATGPSAVIVSHTTRQVPRNGPTWKKVMARAVTEGYQPARG